MIKTSLKLKFNKILIVFEVLKHHPCILTSPIPPTPYPSLYAPPIMLMGMQDIFIPQVKHNMKKLKYLLYFQ